MSVYANEEQQRELEYQDMLDEKYGYDDYEDYLYEDNYEDDCIITNKKFTTKINKPKCEIIRFPMSSNELNMKDKKCDYKTLAIMTIYSNVNLDANEKHRYIYKKDILLNKDEIETLSNRKIDTICRNVKKLCKLESKVVEAKNTDKGIVYIVNYATEETNTKGNKVYRKYVPIEEKILRYLINNATSNVIKTYILLKYRCMYGDENGTRVSGKDIASNIGLCVNSNDSLTTVYDMIAGLSGHHLIKVKKRYITEVLDDGKESVKCYNYFTITEYDEWLEWRNDYNNEK